MFKTEDEIWRGALVDQLMLPSSWERENLGSNLGCFLLFIRRFFIENNLSYMVGGNITSVAISATAGGNITSVALRSSNSHALGVILTV